MNDALSALEARLADLAATGQTITYGALARDLGWRMGQLTAALETLMAMDARAGALQRASLCAARLGHGLPAAGFFQAAEALGLPVGDPAAFVDRQRQALFAAAQSRVVP